MTNDGFVIPVQLLGDPDRLTNIDIGLVHHLNTSVTAEAREQILLTIANRTDNGPQLFNAIVSDIDPPHWLSTYTRRCNFPSAVLWIFLRC